jgi:hypothetical protein
MTNSCGRKDLVVKRPNPAWGMEEIPIIKLGSEESGRVVKEEEG